MDDSRQLANSTNQAIWFDLASSDELLYKQQWSVDVDR